MKRVYLVALIVALMVGGATFFFAKGLMEKTSIENAPTTKVIVAIADVPGGTTITADMEGTVFIEKQVLAQDAIPDAVMNLGDIMGQIVAQDLYAGEQVSFKRFSQRGSDETALSFSLLEGEVAYSIAAEADRGVDGYIKPGDTIDILVAEGVEQDGKEEITNATILFKDLKVLKVATYADTIDAKADAATEGEVKQYTSVTIKTTEEQAMELYLMERKVEDGFKFILNSRVEAEKVQ